MKIITGKTASEHVNSEDDRALHAGTFGQGSYVLNVGEMFKPTIESSNTIRIDCGDLVHQGTHARIPYGEYDIATIDNGQTGFKRIDMIVGRYERNGGFETFNIITIKGQPSASAPVAPDYENGNILEGAEVSDMPLYEVMLDGVNIVSVTPLYKIGTGLDDVYRKNEVYNKNEEDGKHKTLEDAIATAQNTANTAVSNAATAQNTANTAVNNAATAQNTANIAATDASEAQDNINKIKSNSTNIVNRYSGLFTNCETSIIQASDLDGLKSACVTLAKTCKSLSEDIGNITK